MPKVIIIGAGVSGLFASYLLLQQQIEVELYDQKAFPGAKWLLAGSSGLNLSSSYPKEKMKDFYGEAASLFDRWFQLFSAKELSQFIAELGGSLKEGSAYRLLEKKRSAKELLFAWWQRLIQSDSFSFFPQHRFIAFSKGKSDSLEIQVENLQSRELLLLSGDALLFACGGISYPQTGSDGGWQKAFQALSFPLIPFAPANCAFSVEWSEKLFPSATAGVRYRYLKNIAVSPAEKREWVRGDLVITPFGVEGLPVYRHAAFLRKKIVSEGSATLLIDLFPDLTLLQIEKRMQKGAGKRTLSHFLASTLSLSKEGFSLMMESLSPIQRNAFREIPLKRETLALLKALPLQLIATAPIERAISCAGGVALEAFSEKLMLLQKEGCFACGEMLDWEAPTGGFLMQGCFTTAAVAVAGIVEWFQKKGCQ